MAHDELRLTTTALAALAEIDGLRCGPLSPLAQVPRPAGGADRAGLIACLQGLDETRRLVPAALIDPHLTLALVVADREHQLLGQYLWPDRCGIASGYRVERETAALVLAGPFTLEEVEQHLLDRLGLAAVAEIPPARYTLTADQAWALLALIDTYGTATALRTAARATGFPPGVARDDIVASWEAGLARPNPGWAVSLAGMLVPASVPEDFPKRLDAVLGALDEAGMITRLEGEPGDPLGDVLLFGEGLELLCRGLSAGGVGFGLVRSELVAPGRVEVGALAAWCTPRGVALLDLSHLEDDRAELLLSGPTHLVELLHHLFGTSDLPPADAPPPNDQFDPARLLAQLQAVPRPASPGPTAAPSAAFCHKCGRALQPDSRFCPACGTPVPG